jgi:hypothetical protein
VCTLPSRKRSASRRPRTSSPRRIRRMTRGSHSGS